MKKLVLCLLITLSVQYISAQQVTFGVKAGGNLASFTDNFKSPFDYNYKFGFQVGGFIKIPIADRFFLQPELLYSLQGTKYDITFVNIILPQTPIGSDTFFNSDANRGQQNESNIILPVMLKYYVLENFSIEAGPQLDYLFSIKSDRIVVTDQGVVNEGDELVDESDFNFGVNLGLGYEFGAHFGVGFRYNYGFNRLYRGELEIYDNGFKRRNSIFNLSFEYRFN